MGRPCQHRPAPLIRIGSSSTYPDKTAVTAKHVGVAYFPMSMFILLCWLRGARVSRFRAQRVANPLDPLIDKGLGGAAVVEGTNVFWCPSVGCG
ncbi:hypothetical protein CONLIGDRAFT_273833 [Coniochaeta ligniaria NRRL 30616]|uniref:Uncharacterized protein n=1 Tax=Coniochaeta ligniaria NRRL 30616 TaxID=1408157 RepID=A0A1J7IZE1_9PEZI|nr:hypothetical protein CONLIGDRAFT_273833 [Coniochaeta ligniaria NRRL 30616]